MASVLIIACNKCGGLLLAKTEQKRRTCPYCGLKLDLSMARKIASAENSLEASKILRKLKKDAILARDRSKRPLQP